MAFIKDNATEGSRKQTFLRRNFPRLGCTVGKEFQSHGLVGGNDQVVFFKVFRSHLFLTRSMVNQDSGRMLSVDVGSCLTTPVTHNTQWCHDQCWLAISV